MASHTLLLTHTPMHHLTRDALLFCEQLIEKGESIDGLFCYMDACYLALKPEIPAGEDNLYEDFKVFALKHGLEIHICSGASARRGIFESMCEAPFVISGLVSLADMMQSSDHTDTF